MYRNRLLISEHDCVYHLRPDFKRVLPKTSPDYLHDKIIGYSRGIILLLQYVLQHLNALRRFPSFALGFPTAYDSASSERAQAEHARVHNARDFPQTKLDSEINAHFLKRAR